MNISLINYQLFSGKYILSEENGNRKEYNLYGGLIFECEYLNGKRNGKGKEYNEEGVLIYEGEYLNGKRNGKGKEYNEDGRLLFDGQYSNGLKWIGNVMEINSVNAKAQNKMVKLLKFHNLNAQYVILIYVKNV